ncbi:hypothetical protein X777_07224 [Ooceraea biroi]|uniref:Uncharacterized protein n=1 Tax=Ooceraea biroi TaxID=2015173 RepID=A0A026WBM4_OOCBI|nr:hypothetical protein X777_07224 [Ooceraea biroi]
MPGQSARAARNVIARTLLEELFRKLSKRRELAVVGGVLRLSCG